RAVSCRRRPMWIEIDDVDVFDRCGRLEAMQSIPDRGANESRGDPAVGEAEIADGGEHRQTAGIGAHGLADEVRSGIFSGGGQATGVVAETSHARSSSSRCGATVSRTRR